MEEASFSQEKHPLEKLFSVNLASNEAPNHIYSNGKGTISDASILVLMENISKDYKLTTFYRFYLPNRKYYPDEVAFDFDGDYLNPELKKYIDANGELRAKRF